MAKQILMILGDITNLNTAKKGQGTRFHLSSAPVMVCCLNLEHIILSDHTVTIPPELFFTVWKYFHGTVSRNDILALPSLLQFHLWALGQNSAIDCNISFTVMIPRVLVCHFIEQSGPDVTGISQGNHSTVRCHWMTVSRSIKFACEDFNQPTSA